MVLLRNDIDDIRKAVAEQVSLTIMSEEFQNRLVDSLMEKLERKINEKIEKLEENITSLQREMESVRSENLTLKKNIDAQEQYARNKNIRIFGLKYEKNENISDIVINLLQKK